MGSASALSVMLFQGGDSASPDQYKWLVIFVGIIAFCSFVQFCILVGAAIAGLKAYKTVSAEVGMLKQKALPMVASVQGVVTDMRPKINAISAKVQEIVEDSAPKVKVLTAKFQEIVEDSTPKVKVMTSKFQEMVEDATPKVKTVTTNVADISGIAKTKVQEFESTLGNANDTLREANNKTRAQVEKVDGMISSTLKATSDIGNTIHRGIRMPVMEVAGVVNGVKAALDVLVGKSKGASSERETHTPGRPSSGPYGVPRPPQASTGSPFAADPSSAVPLSPGGQEVVDRFHKEQKVKSIY